MENMNDALDEVNASLKTLGKEYAGLIGPFSVFMRKVEAEGALSTSTKELISVALSVKSQCKWCIAFHVRGALDAGASKDEIMEACFVAVLMGGGPSLMYAQLVLKAIEEYRDKR
ncbi:MAG: carboxymuconolactone decarboxylase family protein [Candidatus Altiarchaeota archaeon]|nr:carboxymuconolactone decarboxylase family protein [Candidatus Altiarchaeota archaeon]